MINSTIGYCDTIIYSQLEDYEQYGYQGKSPLFIQIWFPTDKTNRPPIKFGDLKHNEFTDNLSKVHSALLEKMDTAIVEYSIARNIATGDSIVYDGVNYYDVLHNLKSIKTNSRNAEFPKDVDLPVIVYHHGAQGQSTENVLLFEYFASRGYVVVASNFHLPYSQSNYGYSAGSDDERLNLAKDVIRFAKSLTKSNEVFFIGHSWGAQVGFELLWEDEWADAFVSLETTLEFYGKERIEEWWPDLYEILDIHADDYSLPILMIANTLNDRTFFAFDQIKGSDKYHVSTKTPFGHESYTSLQFLRLLAKDRISNPDQVELERQFFLYARHLALIHEFLYSVRNQKELDTSRFKSEFYLTKK